MRWSFVSWCGDFRLEADGASKSTLTIEDPTPAEVERLGAFLKKARSKGWIDQHVGFAPSGKIVIPIDAPLSKAGRILLGSKPKGILTAVVSKRGRVSAEIEGAAEKAVKLVDSPDAEAAASVRRPTLCCPYPQPGPDVRATEVLAAFLTPTQRADWARDRVLHCYGNLSGRLYQIAHRHHPLAIARKKIVWDVEGSHVMHAYDWSVPPAEEVLVMKLVLEHAEHWIRNQSGCLTDDGGPIFDNPFMSERRQASDGLQDAAFMRALGTLLHSVASVLGPKEVN